MAESRKKARTMLCVYNNSIEDMIMLVWLEKVKIVAFFIPKSRTMKSG